MIDHSSIESLTAAVQRYFDLMYDGDTSRFDRVFRPTAQLHGLRDGKMAMFTASGYKELTAGRPSPKSLNAPREEEILLMDFASPDPGARESTGQDQQDRICGSSHLSSG